MRTSSLKQRTLTLFWGIALAAAPLPAGVAPAYAQSKAASMTALSPGAQRVLQVFLSALPADAQSLTRNAISALGSQRAEVQLSALQSLPPAAIQTIARNMVGILGLLQPQYRQPFVNGLFQVSVPEVQFASRVVYQVSAARQAMAAQAPAASAPAQVMVPQQGMNAENQAAMAAEIMATQQRIYQLNQRTLMDAHMNTMNIGDGWIRALGTTPYPIRVSVDP